MGNYASFFVFAHATDGAIEAYPLHEWYNFQPIQRYKALSAEEAEQEFGRRNRTMSKWSFVFYCLVFPNYLYSFASYQISFR